MIQNSSGCVRSIHRVMNSKGCFQAYSFLSLGCTALPIIWPPILASQTFLKRSCVPIEQTLQRSLCLTSLDRKSVTQNMRLEQGAPRAAKIQHSTSFKSQKSAVQTSLRCARMTTASQQTDNQEHPCPHKAPTSSSSSPTSSAPTPWPLTVTTGSIRPA